MKAFFNFCLFLVLCLTPMAIYGQSDPTQQPATPQIQQPTERQKPRLRNQRQQRQMKMRKAWLRLDINQDQRISREEWNKRPKAFDRLDADHDGFITREEMRKMRELRRNRNRSNPTATKPPVN
ncbi:MAG: hypothetical protein AB1757_13015 [Acidobacteriota bacterium]